MKTKKRKYKQEDETMLVVKYERKNFFGERIYTEDSKNHETLKDIQKSFRFLKSDHDVTIQINNTVLFWDTDQYLMQ